MQILYENDSAGVVQHALQRLLALATAGLLLFSVRDIPRNSGKQRLSIRGRDDGGVARVPSPGAVLVLDPILDALLLENINSMGV